MRALEETESEVGSYLLESGHRPCALLREVETQRTRQQTLRILERLVPQAFPENHAHIRIKLTLKGDITLMGVVGSEDKKRLEAAIEQIRHLEFVGSVTNHIVETTS